MRTIPFFRNRRGPGLISILLKRASDRCHARCDYGHDRGGGQGRDGHDRNHDDGDDARNSLRRNHDGDGVATTSNRKDRKDGSSTTAGLLLVWALSHAM